jgi:ribose 5-phosphate isomerase B
MNNLINVNGIMVPIGSHEGKVIVIGSDHRGFEYKNRISEFLRNKGYELIDVGTFSNERCDYPAISDSIGKKVSKDKYNSAGIGICGSGIGILIPASKHPGVYAARCLTPPEAETSRMHNNTNVLGIGADCIDLKAALAVIEAWLTTHFYSDASKEGAYLKRYVQTVMLEQELLKFRNQSEC